MKFVFVYIFVGSSLVSVFLELGGPESQVVSDELHDGGGILVLVFLDLVNVSNGIIKGLLGQLAGFAGVVLDLIMEDGVVKGKAESDGMGGLELLLSELSSLLVGLMGVVSSLVVLSSRGVFGDVSVVVSLHLVVEDLGFSVGGLGDELGVNEVKDLIAVFVELTLNLGFVAAEEADVLGALLFFLLLNGGEGSPGSSSGSDGVLVGNGKEVSLLNGQVSISSHNLVHGVKHVLKPFGLLSNLGHVEVLFPGVGSHSILCF